MQVFDANGAPASNVSPALPTYFHATPSATSAASSARVADLPPDGGERDLPIMHFYSRPNDDRIPIGIAIGFAQGAATRWMPQVDTLRPENLANNPVAQSLREGLVAARAQLSPYSIRPHLPDDPTRQLQWDSLLLTRAPQQTPSVTDVDWVRQARAFNNEALWVNRANEAERFVFYEAKTREHVVLKLTRGNRYSANFRHYVLTNTGAFAVHDVFVVHRQGNELFVFAAPSIPAGATAGFALEEHRIASADQNARMRVALRDHLVAARPDDTTCVMGRDPAVPVEKASSQTLLPEEADTLLRVWGTAFFDQPGTTIVYREDPAYLDQVMPVSIFTDMYHWIELHRAGLALWRGVVLP